MKTSRCSSIQLCLLCSAPLFSIAAPKQTSKPVPQISIENPDHNPELYHFVDVEAAYVRLTSHFKPGDRGEIKFTLDTYVKGSRTKEETLTQESIEYSKGLQEIWTFGVAIRPEKLSKQTFVTIVTSYNDLREGPNMFSGSQSQSKSHIVNFSEFVNTRVITNRTKNHSLPLNKSIELLSFDVQDDSTGKSRRKYIINAILTVKNEKSESTL